MAEHSWLTTLLAPVNVVTDGVAWVLDKVVPAQPPPGGAFKCTILAAEEIDWAKRAAQWSADSYTVKSTTKGLEMAEEYRFVEVKDDKVSVQLVVGYDVKDDSVIVAFRGTDDVLDALRDLDSSAVEAELSPSCICEGEMHHGFKLCLMRVREKVINVVDDLLRDRPSAKRLIITGHSLGGALAMLFSVMVVRDRPWGELGAAVMENVRVITFGSPRCGDRAFADACDAALGSRYVRWTNCDDIIPGMLKGVPGLAEFFGRGYVHCGTPHVMVMPDVHHAATRECYVAPNSREELTPDFTWRRRINEWWVEGIQAGLVDHEIAHYRASLCCLKAAE